MQKPTLYGNKARLCFYVSIEEATFLMQCAHEEGVNPSKLISEFINQLKKKKESHDPH